MTPDALLEILEVLLKQRRGGIVGLVDVIPQDNGWLHVEFGNGRQLAVTVEEIEIPKEHCMVETRQQFWLRRGLELNKFRKVELCGTYRGLGGLGGIHPPESWRKDEIISSIVDIEWGRRPEDQKAASPQLMCPPCAHCGRGEGAPPHRYGGSHYYRYVFNPLTPDVPYYEPCTVPDCGQTIEYHEAYSIGHFYECADDTEVQK